MPPLRSDNKEKRRERILAEARNIIAHRGYEALNIRNLAEASELTVPTIYNLIGNKEALINSLMMECYDSFAEQMAAYKDVPIRENPQAVADSLVALFGASEDYYRSAALASEKLNDQHDIHGHNGIMREPLEQLVIARYEKAIDEHLLQGNIAPEVMINQMITAFQAPFRDWIYNAIDLNELHRRFLLGNYLALAADATAEFRQDLLQRIEVLHKDSQP